MMNHIPEHPLVLVADDEIPTNKILSRIFEREGYRIHTAQDGIAALESARRLIPDLILLDIQMPGMNGFEVLQALRDNPATAGIPTIIITAKARQPNDIARGLDLGADDFMAKPFDPGELLARAHSKIRARKLEDALQRRTQELEVLLRVSEALNQHISISELSHLIPFLVLDLLPGNMAAIYITDEHEMFIPQQVEFKNIASKGQHLDHDTVIQRFTYYHRPMLWPSIHPPLLDDYAYGMAVPLQHSEHLLGMLMLVSNEHPYDENHLRLFEGIGRQSALAIKNTQLYEIQLNYSLHLEEMVEAKTAELKSTQQMLIRAEKLASIGHLASSIAHEINNPLQPIKIVLEDMMEDLQNGLPVDIRAIQITQENVERIRRIVNQLLDFAGKRSNNTTEFQLIDLGNIIEDVVSLNRKLFDKQNMRITTELYAPLRTYGNKDQLNQVLMNLILNAQAAMETGGNLLIRAWVDRNEIILEVSDTGSGIAPENLNKIFDPFFSTKQNGTGLGLFVTYGIIQGHHGTIEVKSKPNVGTTFTIRLPAQQAM